MALSSQFLDELRARTTLSAVISSTLRLQKAGREFKACCPFHNEKTPSFSVVDEKGFYHCHGCGAHGDAIRWLTDQRGLTFMDAVRQLAADAGLDMPERSAEAAARETLAQHSADVLDQALGWYAEQLGKAARPREILAKRGVDDAAIARFGIGFAPAKLSVAAIGVTPERLGDVGLMHMATEGQYAGLWRDRFRNRIMIPIHDARGRVIGFGGRGGDGVDPKYLNSPESATFDKGRVLFNLHRAASAARTARRLVIVEGYFGTIALDAAGIPETVASMGTALTEHQLERAWRVIECPVLLFDGDAAGRKAAMRACDRAIPHAGPGRSLKIGMLPDGKDPDDLVRGADDLAAGKAAIEAVIAAAEPMAAWLWGALLAECDGDTPEGRSGLWRRLSELAGRIRGEETRAQYLADWRVRFDAQFPPPPAGLTHEEMLPGGSIATVSSLGEVERARLTSVSAAWFDRTHEHAAATVKRANGWAWQLGRNVASGTIAAELGVAALRVLKDRFVAAHPDAKWRDVERAYEGGASKGLDIEGLLRTMRCAEFNRTDKGNSERWIAQYGEDFLYTTTKGWLGWDERRYRLLNQEKDTTPAEVLASVVRMVEAIQEEARFVRDTGWPEREPIDEKLMLDDSFIDPRRPAGMDVLILTGRKPERLSAKLMAWATASEAAGRINCIAGLVKRSVTVELSAFDTDPMLLNCLNGTLRFVRSENGQPAHCELLPHSRADRLTKLTACDYDPKAKAANFRKLIEWAQPEEARRRYVQQWMGYGLTGDTGEQIFHIWWGPSAANGKSTVSNACRGAVGDYGAMTKAETFLDVGAKKGADAASPGLAVLPGIRLLISGEPPKEAKVDEALINVVTGGDEMMARDNFRSFFWFTPAFKWTLSCNRLPPIPQGTEGIWRRVKVVLWESHLEEHEKDRDLPAKLRGEYGGILAWMVRGAIDWMNHGFIEPDSVREATAEFKDESDPATRFLHACTEPFDGGSVQSSLLYEVFTGWAAAAGEKEWSQIGFSKALKDRLAKKASNGMHWLGIRLTKQKSDFVDRDGNVLVQREDQAAPPDRAATREPDDGPLPGWEGIAP